MIPSRLRVEPGQQALDPLLLAHQRRDHLAQPGHLGLRGLLGALSGHREPIHLLFLGVALPGEVFDGRGPAEHLLRIAAREEREGLVGRTAHVARRGEPGEVAMRGVELAVQRPHPGRCRLGGGFRPGERLQPTAVLPGQLGGPAGPIPAGAGRFRSASASFQFGMRHSPERCAAVRRCHRTS